MVKKAPDHLTQDIRAKVNILRRLNVRIANDHPGGVLFLSCPAWPHTRPDGPGRIWGMDEIDRAIKYARFRWEVTMPQQGLFQQHTHPAGIPGCGRWKKKLIIRKFYLTTLGSNG